MKKWLVSILVVCCICVINQSQLLASTPPSSLPEIHLLIDVSGSMKATDPEDMRFSAVKLFNFLINKKAVMSINIFSTQVKEILSLSPVNDIFLKQFMAMKDKISEAGQWTNINLALNKANQSWSYGERVIILLTDGRVDLGSDARNAPSLIELNEKTIPALQKNNVRVFTIGFSNEADGELLYNIAFKTNGFSQVITSAKQLDKALYELFSALFQPNGAPIAVKGDAIRGIYIDHNIQEFILIIKKQETIGDVFLSDPSGIKRPLERFANQTTTPQYKIIKVINPSKGEWLLSGPPQAIERVLIASDINLTSNFTSGTFYSGEHFSLNAAIDDPKQKAVLSQVIHGLQLSFNLQGKGRVLNVVIPLFKDTQFKQELLLNLPEGTYKALLRANSSTISREQEYTVNLYANPFKTSHDKQGHFILELLKPEWFDNKSMILKVLQNDKPVNASISHLTNMWDIDLCNPTPDLHHLLIHAQIQSLSGRQVQFMFPIDTVKCESKLQPILQSVIPHFKAKNKGL